MRQVSTHFKKLHLWNVINKHLLYHTDCTFLLHSYCIKNTTYLLHTTYLIMIIVDILFYFTKLYESCRLDKLLDFCEPVCDKVVG